MKQCWKYQIREISISNNDEYEKVLNQYGKDGWELFRVDGIKHIFKRPYVEYPDLPKMVKKSEF